MTATPLMPVFGLAAQTAGYAPGTHRPRNYAETRTVTCLASAPDALKTPGRDDRVMTRPCPYSIGGVTAPPPGLVIRSWRFVIRLFAAIFAAFVAVLFTADTAGAASVSTLHHREHRQRLLLHARLGTIRFFHNHAWLSRTVPGRRALRVAHVWIPIIQRELAETRAQLLPRPRTVPQIICSVFGPNCGKALSVASCESHFYLGATNGQYFGVFQMGSGERARFGGSSTDPWDQVRAAFRYFSIAGWGPWECA